MKGEGKTFWLADEFLEVIECRPWDKNKIEEVKEKYLIFDSKAEAEAAYRALKSSQLTDEF